MSALNCTHLIPMGISTIYYDLSMATKKEYPEKYGWWISKLNSLAINTETKNEEIRDVQALESLTDEVKHSINHLQDIVLLRCL